MSMLFAPKENKAKEVALIQASGTLKQKIAESEILLYGEYVRGYALGDESPGDFEQFLVRRHYEKRKGK